MKSTKFALCLQTTVVPFGILMASAMIQLGCAGAEQHPAQPQQPQYVERDFYEVICVNAGTPGDKCPPKAKLYRDLGLCSDRNKDCPE